MTNNDFPKNVYSLRQGDFDAIPGNPWVYWVQKRILDIFSEYDAIQKRASICIGMRTGDNQRFTRFWWEISQSEFKKPKEKIKSLIKWYPYMKGGGFSRWYGYQERVVEWLNNGLIIKENTKFHYPYLGDNLGWKISNESFYFKEGVTWSAVSSTGFGVRYLPPGFIFDVGGSAGFVEPYLLFSFLAFMNSTWTNYTLRLLNPTINFQVGDISRVPFIQPSDLQKNEINFLVPLCIHNQQVNSIHSENTFDFCAPLDWQKGTSQFLFARQHLEEYETQINNLIYQIYNIDDNDQKIIERELASGMLVSDEADSSKPDDEEESSTVVNSISLALPWLSYTIGIVLNRFQPGTPGALGSGIYRRTDFAIGSLPEPTEEEFNELVGEPSQFAYTDEQGGRHVFSRQVEDGLRKLALPDGIAVFDLNHPRDLPTLVSKALELMLGQAQAQEVIQQAAGGDLRKYLEKDFFTQHHIKQYRKRPVYWPIQSSKRSYGFVLFHEKIDRNTFYALQQEPYLPTKRRAVQLRLEELGKKVLTVQGAARKPIEKEMDELRQLGEELAQFAKDLDTITRGGYEPEADWIDDGVILRMAPLWSVIPLWKSEPKKYWDELAAGKYDWSRIAMKYWPERVKQACKKNKSYAIAHGHEEWYAGK